MNDFSPYLTLITNSLKKRMYEPAEIDKLCLLSAGAIKTELDGFKILRTIVKLESAYGADCRPRFEPAYYPGGMYFRKSKMLNDGYENWGSLVSFSYGPFQIMWVKAAELGYPISASPLDLWSGYISCPFVVELINDANSRGVKKLEEILAVYNGGMGALKRPTESTKRYITNGLAIYSGL